MPYRSLFALKTHMLPTNIGLTQKTPLCFRLVFWTKCCIFPVPSFVNWRTDKLDAFHISTLKKTYSLDKLCLFDQILIILPFYCYSSSWFKGSNVTRNKLSWVTPGEIYFLSISTQCNNTLTASENSASLKKPHQPHTQWPSKDSYVNSIRNILSFHTLQPFVIFLQVEHTDTLTEDNFM